MKKMTKKNDNGASQSTESPGLVSVEEDQPPISVVLPKTPTSLPPPTSPPPTSPPKKIEDIEDEVVHKTAHIVAHIVLRTVHKKAKEFDVVEATLYKRVIEKIT